MFDLGWSKILILAVVAIVVVGPKELPALLRTLGQFIAQLRRHAAEFRTQFDEAIRSTELEQIKKDVEAIKTDAQASLRGIERSLEQDMSEAKASVDAAFEAADGKAAVAVSPSPTDVVAPPSSTNEAPTTPLAPSLPDIMPVGQPVQPEPVPMKTGA